MKLVCSVSVLLLSIFSAFGQKISFSQKRSNTHTYVKGDSFEGVVFSKDFVFPFMQEQAAEKRFTPSQEDIEDAEKLLAKKIQSVNSLQVNQGGVCGPIIHENLKRFVRQYYGYINEKGDKVVYISCLLKSNYADSAKQTPNWLKGVVVVLNGGSNYWQVQANLNKSSLFGLAVNGIERSARR
jgi:hypothetical protein